MKARPGLGVVRAAPQCSLPSLLGPERLGVVPQLARPNRAPTCPSKPRSKTQNSKPRQTAPNRAPSSVSISTSLRRNQQTCRASARQSIPKPSQTAAQTAPFFAEALGETNTRPARECFQTVPNRAPNRVKNREAPSETYKIIDRPLLLI